MLRILGYLKNYHYIAWSKWSERSVNIGLDITIDGKSE